MREELMLTFLFLCFQQCCRGVSRSLGVQQCAPVTLLLKVNGKLHFNGGACRKHFLKTEMSKQNSIDICSLLIPW